MSDEIDQARTEHKDETNERPSEFDFASYPPDTLFHDRRSGHDRRVDGAGTSQPRQPFPPDAPADRRVKKDRRRRIDPTTFEKQYTDAELEFMNAMQRFKDHSGKSFPSHGDVLKVAASLGYRRVVVEPDECCDLRAPEEPSLIQPSTVDA